MRKVIGFWSGHDCSFCVLNEGIPELHTELERHNREKEPAGDSVELFMKHHGDLTNIVGLASCFKPDAIERSMYWPHVVEKTGLELRTFGHHQAHAAHAFYSSNHDEALVVTVDGGGYEDINGQITATMSMWYGKGNKLQHVRYVPIHESNVGGVWSRITRYVFRMETGWPQGHQAGSVMALAAMGQHHRYIDDLRRMLSCQQDLHRTCAAPAGHIKGMSANDFRSPRHPFLCRFEDEVKNDKQRAYDFAAALQLATEEHVFGYLLSFLDEFPNVKNLCLAGGVALNSVMVGKIIERFPQIENVFVPPVPYDGGLCLGAAQYLWHHVMDNKRVVWMGDGMLPYLGKKYSRTKVLEALQPFIENGDVTLQDIDDEGVIELLDLGKIVSVFNERAESGRRALGNRSIIADPRNPLTKDRVNEKVKHRQDWRPFAPSIVREAVNNYFETDLSSPYMSHVVKFASWARPLLPAVVHFDGSARLQTVSKEANPWWHAFLVKWGNKSGHPVLLNTSFNDREPIVEEPIHAVKCFIKTDIDAMYFPEHGLLVKK